jgi:hypothetical protein
MKTEPQTSRERSQLCKLIENMSVAMMTSIDAHGMLVSRPMSVLEMDNTGALWFFTDLRSAKVEQLDYINLNFIDEAHGTYVSLSGHGELETQRAHIDMMWTPFAKPWFPDGPDSPNLALLKFIPNTAEYWDTPNSKMVRILAMAASVVAGKPIALGQHNVLQHLSSPELTFTH